MASRTCKRKLPQVRPVVAAPEPDDQKRLLRQDERPAMSIALRLSTNRPRELTAEQLADVLTEDRTLVHLPGAVDASVCSTILDAIRDVEFEPYAATNGLTGSEPVSKLATTGTLYDYYDSPDGFEPYFFEARHQMAFMREVFAQANAPDPLGIMRDLLQGAWSGHVEVAVEPGLGIYNAGVIRSIPSGALPHVDNAAEECPHLVVGDIVAQGSILIYLTSPLSGGGLRVFHKSPNGIDRRENRQDWGFSPAAVAGEAFTGVTPAAGDVVVFPTTLIHAVDPVIAGNRISVSSFFGRTRDDRLILWS